MNMTLRIAAVQARCNPLRRVAVGTMLSLAALAAQAATIVGGSDLLNAGSAAQLESWVGQGPLTLINIFDKVAGDTSLDFHAAADGRGATFSIIEVTGYTFFSNGTASYTPLDTPVIVGGFNPRSWSSVGAYNFSPTDEERTAFVFNLNQGLKFAQRPGWGGAGYTQTYKGASYGPTFGQGFDLYVDSSLNVGSSELVSYASCDWFNCGILDLVRYPQRYPEPWLYRYQIGQIEVFSVPNVPEPGTWALMLIGLLSLIATTRLRSAHRGT